MIYVDAPIYKKSPKGRKTYAHMVADTLEEVRAFATQIGVKPHFWHSKGLKSHFDITSEQHAEALKQGATQVESSTLLLQAMRMNLLVNTAGGNS